MKRSDERRAARDADMAAAEAEREMQRRHESALERKMRKGRLSYEEAQREKNQRKGIPEPRRDSRGRLIDG
jgi:hypothetical protein